MSIKEMMGILIRFCKGNEFSDSFQIVVRNMSVIFCVILPFPLSRARALDKSLLFFTVTSVTLLWQGVDCQVVKFLFSKCYGFNARNVEDGAKRGL